MKKESGLRAKRGRSKVFWGIFVSRMNSLIFQAGFEQVEIFQDQEIPFAYSIAFGEPYCLEFFSGTTCVKKISDSNFRVVWKAGEKRRRLSCGDKLEKG
jgi:hypothetical protein